MEVIVKIPKNTYEVPVEVRPDAVQAICEAFLNSYPHYKTTDEGTSSKVYINEQGRWCFSSVKLNKQEGFGYYEPRGCEIKAAFKALIDAGYFLFRNRNNFCHETEYNCSEKPYYRGYQRVSEFNDFID